MGDTSVSRYLSDILCVPYGKHFRDHLLNIIDGQELYDKTLRYLSQIKQIISMDDEDTDVQNILKYGYISSLDAKMEKITDFKKKKPVLEVFFSITNDHVFNYKKGSDFTQLSELFYEYNENTYPVKKLYQIIKQLGDLLEPKRYASISKISKNVFYTYVFCMEVEKMMDINLNSLFKLLESLGQLCKNTITPQLIGNIILDDFTQFIFTPLFEQVTNFVDSFHRRKLTDILFKYYIEIDTDFVEETLIKGTFEKYIRYAAMHLEIFGIKSWLDKLYFKKQSFIFTDEFLFNEKDMKNIHALSITLDEASMMPMNKLISLEFPVQIRAGFERYFVEFWYGINKLFESRNLNIPALHIIDTLIKESNKDLLIRLRRHSSNPCISGKEEQAISSLISLLQVLKIANVQNPELKMSSLFFNMNQHFEEDPEDLILIQEFGTNVETFIDMSIKIDELLACDQVDVPELEIVNKVVAQNYHWHVNINDGITIRPPGENDKTKDIPYLVLKLAVSKLNISSGVTGRSEEKKDSILFVKRFQNLEIFKTKLEELKAYFFEEAESDFEFKGIDNDEAITSQIHRLNDMLQNEIELILNKEAPTIMTREYICQVFSFITNNSDAKVISILKSALGCSEKSAIQFIKSVKTEKPPFPKYISMLAEFCSNYQFDEDIIKMFETGTKTISNEDGDAILDVIRKSLVTPLTYQEPSLFVKALFYIYMKMQSKPPTFNQMLVCTDEITPTRVKQFFTYFIKSNVPFKGNSKLSDILIFTIVNPQNLGKEAYTILSKEIKNAKSYVLGMARLVIMTANKDTNINPNQKFSDLICNFRRYTMPGKINYELFGAFLFSRTSKYMKSFLTYRYTPRTGKTYMIKRWICESGPHTYTRIVVDKSITLTRLIELLRAAPVVVDRTTCIHFNIDGTIGYNFSLYMLMLAMFHSLSDGESLPFNCSSKYSFYFEFGSNPEVSAVQFFYDIFPIGRHMTFIDVPPADALISFDDYVVCLSSSGYDYVEKKIGTRSYLKTAASIQQILEFNKEGKLKKMRFESLMTMFNRFYDNAGKSLVWTYSQILELLHQPWIPDKFKTVQVQISQISEVAMFLHKYKDVVFNRIITDKEMSRTLFRKPIRYILLNMLVEEAVVTNGITYRPISVGGTDNDMERVREIIEYSSATNRTLLCGKKKHYIISQEPLTRKSTENQLSVYSWDSLESDSVTAFNMIDDTFDISQNNFTAAYAMHAVLEYQRLNELYKERLKMVWDEGRYLKDIVMHDKDVQTVAAKHNTLAPFLEAAVMLAKSSNLFKLSSHPIEQTNFYKSSALFVKRLTEYLSDKMLYKYSLTLHNIKLIAHIIYRIETTVPVIIMGETGSGKTYTIDYLADVYGDQAVFVKMVIDGGTTEDMVKEWTKSKITNFRTKIEEDIYNNKISNEKAEATKLVIFFDEINTANCQWFLKSLVVDRMIENTHVPKFVRFVCAVNPVRRIRSGYDRRLRALEQDLPTNSASLELRDLVYKVRKMPEAMVRYLLPADPPRTYSGPMESLSNLSEFEVMLKKISLYSLSPIMNVRYSHFSQLPEFCASFDDEFYETVFGMQHEQKKFLLEETISDIIVYATRLLVDPNQGFFKDPSFASIREAERCVRLIKYFYQFGIFTADGKTHSIKKMREAFVLSLSVTFWLRLSDYLLELETMSSRDVFMDKICTFWSKNNTVPEFQPISIDEWKQLLKTEYTQYGQMFLGDTPGLSLNNALSENIWTAFVCMMNNIPLWIIGLPGTSKSVAVNLVFQRLINNDISVAKFRNLPRLISQTFMCSEFSRSEALLDQLHRISMKAAASRQGLRRIPVLLLEEIGHADLSPYLPLKCLNRIIDDGYTLPSGETIKVVLFGLSNYKMDSAKLNRGILIVRDQLNLDEKLRTSIDIFGQTANSIHSRAKDMSRKLQAFLPDIEVLTRRYHELVQMAGNDAPFIGLRDFYGVIRSFAQLNQDTKFLAIARNFNGPLNGNKDYIGDLWSRISNSPKPTVAPADLIKSNTEEIWDNMKIPLMRHLMVPTDGIAAAEILTDMLGLSGKTVKYIFGDNFSGLPSDEWISNDLKLFAKAMSVGETVVFIGDHPCFGCLYDVFNLMYDDAGSHSFALISFGGDSYAVEVSKKFRVVINIDKEQYVKLPPPFLNRFEKIPLDFFLILDAEEKRVAGNLRDKAIEYFETNNFSDFFGLYNPQHFESVVYLNRSLDFNFQELLALSLLNCSPGRVAYTSTRQPDILDVLGSTAFVRSNIPNLIQSFEEFTRETRINISVDRTKNNISAAFNQKWDEKHGIQAVCVVPYFQDLSALDAYGRLVIADFNPRFLEDDVSCVRDIKGTVILIVRIGEPYPRLQQRIFHLQSVLSSLHSINRILHTIILVDASCRCGDLRLVQSIEWPIIYMDMCISSSFDCESKRLNLQDVLYNSPADIINDTIIFRSIFDPKILKSQEPIVVKLVRKYTRNALKESTIFRREYVWLNSIMSSLPAPPESITELYCSLLRDSIHNVSNAVESLITNPDDSPTYESMLSTVVRSRITTSVRSMTTPMGRMTVKNPAIVFPDHMKRPQINQFYEAVWEVIFYKKIDNNVDSYQYVIADSLCEEEDDVNIDADQIMSNAITTSSFDMCLFAEYLAKIAPDVCIDEKNFDSALNLMRISSTILIAAFGDVSAKCLFNNLTDTWIIFFFSCITHLYRILPSNIEVKKLDTPKETIKKCGADIALYIINDRYTNGFASPGQMRRFLSKNFPYVAALCNLCGDPAETKKIAHLFSVSSNVMTRYRGTKGPTFQDSIEEAEDSTLMANDEERDSLQIDFLLGKMEQQFGGYNFVF